MARKKEEEMSHRFSGMDEHLWGHGDASSYVFVMLYTTSTPDDSKMNLILAAFSGLGMYTGGQTLQEGKLAELGNMIMSLPSTNRGRALDEARRKAISQFEPEIKSQKVRVQQDERGLIITLASDAFLNRPVPRFRSRRAARPFRSFRLCCDPCPAGSSE